MQLPTSSKFNQVLILGAGTAGLLQAVLMKSCGLSFLMLERRSGRRASSRVGLLYGPALEILQRAGLLEIILPMCRPVDRATVRSRAFVAGDRVFHAMQGGGAGALSIQQADLEKALLNYLEVAVPDSIFRSVALDEVQNVAGAVRVRARFGVSPAELTAAFVVATDGPNSPARASLGRGNAVQLPPAFFIAGDFADGGELGDAIRLTTDAAGLVESLPVPRGSRRWVVQTHGLVRQPETAFIADAVRERVGIDLSARETGLIAGQRVEGWVAEELFKGKIVLAGDSAYGLPPFGGGALAQAVLDARDVAGAIQHVVQSKAAADTELTRYAAGCKERVSALLQQQGELLAAGSGASAGLLRGFARAVASRLPGRNPAEQLYAP